MKRTSTATILAPSRAAADVGAVEALRRRLAGTTAREHVVLDFLEDDLRETRAAVDAVATYLDEIEGALARETPTADDLVGLAGAVDPAVQVENLEDGLSRVRRRLAQVAARM